MAVGDRLAVTGDGVRLRAQPSTDAQILATCASGTLVTVTAEQGAWTGVTLADGSNASGFISSQFLAPAPAGDYLSRVQPQNVFPMFPVTPQKNIVANLPFVEAGLRKCALADRNMLLMALGTIRAETAGFVPISEGQSQFNTPPGGAPFSLYDPGTSIGKTLGNTQPGDGARFKGRGYVQLTGRSNYTHVGGQIGVDLAGNPDLANDGATAGDILAQFLKNSEAKVRAALAANDLKTARRLVNGGSHGLDDFTAAYNAGLQSLPA
jgi:Bacterial SH3 domain/Chitinase class I